MLWTFGRSLDLFVGGQQSGAGGRLSGLGEWFGRVVWGLGFGVWDLDFSGLNIGLIRILVAVTQRDACKYQKTLLRTLNQKNLHKAPNPTLRRRRRCCAVVCALAGHVGKIKALKRVGGWGLGVGVRSWEFGLAAVRPTLPNM